jgi:hypothetical protein
MNNGVDGVIKCLEERLWTKIRAQIRAQVIMLTESFRFLSPNFKLASHLFQLDMRDPSRAALWGENLASGEQHGLV